MTHQPPGTFHPPDTAATIHALQRRVHALEQRPVPLDGGPRFEATATNPAPIEVGIPRRTSRWWPWRSALVLDYLIVTADDVDASTTVEVRRTGVAVESIVFAVDSVIRLGVAHTWTLGDYLDLTVAGAVGNLTVQLMFRGEGNCALVFSVPAAGGG